MAIKVNIVTQFDSRGLKQAQRDLAQVGQTIGRSLDVAVVGGIAAATTGLVSAIKASSDYLAQMTGVQQVFGTASKSVEEFAKTAAQSAGLSATEALTSAKTFGLFANAAGLGGQSAADFATKLVQLSGDLGSFNEIPTAQVLADIQSGLQGQAEPLRKYGIFLTDLKLKEEAKNLALYSGTGALNDQQKMLASYSLIMKSTQIQQGDFAKYSTDLGNSTKTLTSQLADLSVEIGNAVRPAVAELIPQLQALVPLIGTALKEAVASVDWKAFFDAVVGGFKFLIDNGQKIATFIAIAWGLTKVFGAMKIALDLLAVATGLFRTQLLILQSSTVLGAAITILGVFAGLMITSQIGVDKETEALKNNIYYQKKFNEAKKEGIGWSDVAEQLGGKSTADKQLAGEMARFGAMEKAYKNYVAPTSGIDTIADEIAKIGSSNTKLASSADKAADKLKAERTALIAFRKEMAGLTTGLNSLTVAATNMGQFESAVVDTFDSINAKLAEGIANKTFAQKGVQGLKDYIKAEQSLLLANAKQRDDLIKKRGLAETLIADVKGALMGLGNISGLLDTETKQVTKSMSTMVNGLLVTTKTVVDEIVGGKGVIGKLKDVVAKTKAFAVQLTELKKLGLDPDLFKQIVDAGPDVGGQLANEILAGGKDSVKALNDTFTELKTATAGIAEQTAVVMYNAGVDVAGGLVAGLLSQEAALIAAAKTLAEAFNAEYQAKLNALQIPSSGAVDTGGLRLGDIKLAGEKIGASAIDKQNAALAAKLINTPQYTAFGSTSYITVNAGVGTNGKAVGQAIQAELNKYAKANK